MRLCAAAALILGLAPTAHAQMDFSDEIPSLTGAREPEMLATYAFARQRPRMYAPVPLLHLPLTPYTEMDDENPWSEVRVDAALQYARFTFGRGGIVLDRGPLGRAPREEMSTPQEKHLRGAGHGETLVYMVDALPGRFIGGVEASKTKYPFSAILLQNGVPVLTVLPHALGRRLNATISERPYSMMLNDRTLVAVFGASLTGAAGFFDPRRFGFSDDECNVMREALLRETQCAPRAHVFQGRGHDRWTHATLAERRAARRIIAPWPLGATEPDDLVVSPSFAQDGLIIFALHAGAWQGFFWRYAFPRTTGEPLPGVLEVYRGFSQAGGLGLAVHPAAQEIELLTFAEGATVQVHSTPWMREMRVSSRRPRPVRVETVPCRVMLTSGPVGEGGAARPLAVVCHDRIWRLWKNRAAEAFMLPRPAQWASLTRRCNDDALLWLGTDAGPQLWRVPAFGPIEQEPLPPWAAYPAVREVPFSATWGGTPRSLDRVNLRRFDASQTPRFLPAVSEPRPAESGLWVRYEDAQGPGWVGWVDGKLWVE